MLDSLRVKFNDYLSDLPTNICESAIESSIYTFVVSAVISQDINAGVECAVTAALVSIISSLVLPIFKVALSDSTGKMKWYHQGIYIFTNLGISQLLINNCIIPNTSDYLTIQKVHLFAGAIFTVGLNLILNGFDDRDTATSWPYVLTGPNAFVKV